MDSLSLPIERQRDREREKEVGNAPTPRVSRFQSVDSFPAGYENETFSLPNPPHPRESWKHEPDAAPQSCPPPVSRYDGIFRLGGAIEENVTKGSRTNRLWKGREGGSLVSRLILTRWRELRWARLLRLCYTFLSLAVFFLKKGYRWIIEFKVFILGVKLIIIYEFWFFRLFEN